MFARKNAKIQHYTITLYAQIYSMNSGFTFFMLQTVRKRFILRTVCVFYIEFIYIEGGNAVN